MQYACIFEMSHDIFCLIGRSANFCAMTSRRPFTWIFQQRRCSLAAVPHQLVGIHITRAVQFLFQPNRSVMAPIDSSPAPLASNGNFEFICSLKANNLVPVHKYKSRVTGLTVLIAEVEGPVVNGYFCLATEAHDDDGLPHTLEHLIFLGSERYPYKGVLDLLANRCLASGTNAWTDTDHTCYTMTTAGSEGFLSLMPIYLDHILYPTLTDSGFITEVHHITGDGEDAGVVYCEMQGRENTGESLTHLALLRAAYPGKCGYKSETGGILKNLRESTDNVKVRSYHKQFYRPENLTLIITGQVKPDEVFKSLRILEEKIISKGDRDDFARPWQDAVPQLEQSQDIEVPYPCDDEDNGMVYVGWRGPSAVSELYKMEACSILLKYLTDTSVSPLQKEFVEIEDPYASRVSYSLSENSECILYLIFDSVPLDKLNNIRSHLLEFLSKIVSFDMTRLKAVIHRHILEVLSQLENSPHDAVAYMLIGDMLYGDSKEALAQRLNAVADFKLMENETESFWLELLQHYIVSAPSITVRGKPSQEKQEQMTIEELKRIEEQKLKLGEIGLKNMSDKFSQAMEQNDQPPPTEMLTSVPIPTTDSIVFHSIKSFSSASKQQHPKFSLTDMPVFMHLDHVHTNFVYMFVLLDTSGISLELRSYLPLLLDSLLELPVKRGDVLVKYEDVVAELEGDTVSASAKIGLEASDRFSCGPYAHTASLMLQLEPAKYERCIVWVRELLYQTQINVERLRVIASKIINDVSQAKRKGHQVVGDLMKGLCFNKESNFHVASMLRQHKFLTALMEKIDTDEGSKQVLSEMEALRVALTDPGRMVVHLAADVDRLTELYEKPASLWTQMLPPEKTATKKPLAVTPDWTMLNPPSDGFFHSCIVGLGCVESSYFSQTTPCIKDFNDPDLAPLLVFLQYLTQLEGPMWKQIRGQGLAYHYHIMPRPNEGLLHMGFYRATNCVGAYKEAKSIVEAHMVDEVKWDQTLFEAARSSLIFEIIEREKSVGDVVTQSLLSYFKKVGPDYNRYLVQLISKVTPADLTRVGPKYVSPLFDSTTAKTTIVCNPSKAAEIALGLQDTQHKLTIFSSLEESFLGQ